jgi:hypothetical protein
MIWMYQNIAIIGFLKAVLLNSRFQTGRLKTPAFVISDSYHTCTPPLHLMTSDTFARWHILT